jgi:hypothetical protein
VDAPTNLSALIDHIHPAGSACFDTSKHRVLDMADDPEAAAAERILAMSDSNALYAIRFPDGSVSLYIDEEYAIERGIDPAKLVRVEIPRELFIDGTVQQIREYVAVYLETNRQGTA